MYGTPQVSAANILDTTTNVWHTLPDIPLARSAPGCILTEINGEEGIMLSGGLNSEQLEQTKRTEFFSLSSNTWKQVIKKAKSMSHMKICIKTFDIWKQLENLVQDRMGHGFFHIGADNKRTVVGGYSQTEGQLFGIETFTEGQGES